MRRNHYHSVTLPSGRVINTSKSLYNNGNEELGILPILGALAGPAIGAVGSLLGGKKKKKKKTAEVSEDSGLDEDDIRDVVKALLADIPSQVRVEVLSALKQSKGNTAQQKDLVNKISSSNSPKLTKVIDLLLANQTQKKATNEHNKIVKTDKRWADTLKGQKEILNKISLLEKKINDSNRKNRAVLNAFGAP